MVADTKPLGPRCLLIPGRHGVENTRPFTPWQTASMSLSCAGVQPCFPRNGGFPIREERRSRATTVCPSSGQAVARGMGPAGHTRGR
jgi:hypothetical protein